MILRKTLRETLRFQGIGLHTGTSSTVLLHPADHLQGVVFRKGDTTIPATLEMVQETPRSTVLEKDGERIGTVEHLMSALFGMGITDVVVEVQGEEIPAMDGSALPFAEAFQESTVDTGESMEATLRAPVQIQKEQARVVLLPGDHLSVSFSLRYEDPFLYTQYLHLPNITPEVYLREIAPARTYLFEAHIPLVRQAGLGKGGSLENTVILTEEGIRNPGGLRFPDEPVRHKILDLLGDLALVGVPYRATILAERSGHELHLVAAKKLRDHLLLGGSFTIHDILRWMPHRFPFLLIDRILALNEARVVAVKNVTYNEPFFQGHFPHDPIMPGVLIIEAMAQAGGFLLLNRVENRENKLLYFSGIDRVKFRRPVRPGDQLILEARLLFFKRNFARIEATAHVDGEKAVSGILTAALVEAPR